MEMSPFLPLCEGLHIERVTQSANVLLVHVVSGAARVCYPVWGSVSTNASSLHPCVDAETCVLVLLRPPAKLLELGERIVIPRGNPPLNRGF
jgi:hypothetical protein